MTAPGAPMEVWDVSAPDMEDGAVLLETIASEVCGTDVHLHHGRLAGVPYPIIPGHVSVGRIHESRGVASDALGVPIAPGDVVTFYDVHEVCGECWHCTVASQPNRCPARRVYGITYAATDGLLGGQIYRAVPNILRRNYLAPSQLSPIGVCPDRLRQACIAWGCDDSYCCVDGIE